MILVIVSARLDLLEFYYITPICFIQKNVPNTNFSYHYILFYIPMCLPMAVAIFFNGATVFKLWRVCINLAVDPS